MKHINRIELQGSIGSIHIFGEDKRVARLSIVTQEVYFSTDRTPVVECTWHSVTVWEGAVCKDLSVLTKGAAVHLIGQVRCQRFVGADGTDRMVPEVIPTELTVIESEK